MQTLEIAKHVKFIKELDEQKDSLEYWHSEHLKISGIYWGVTALYLMDKLDTFDRGQVIEYVMSCYHPESGFGGHPKHDAHLLYTLSAIQILLIYDGLEDSKLPVSKVIEYIKNLQDLETGDFRGDEWGEKDTRFTYAAVNALSLLGALDHIDVIAASTSIINCWNYDGGFGALPNSESHSGQVFCCVSALSILGQIDILGDKHDQLAWWLAERQLPNGGLNGRPEKLEDVCYSWWVLSSLKTLNRVDWIDKHKLTKFILSCQDLEYGGFSDRPGHMGDVFHTLFGLTGLSLLGHDELKAIDPAYCMPTEILQKLGLNTV